MCTPTPHERSAAALVILTCILMPNRIEAQEDCEFVAPTRSMVFTTLTGGATITYLGGPHMLCGEGIEIWADSAVEYSGQRLQHLMGSVRFIDTSGELNADEARYFAEQGRLQAYGHVFVQDTIQGFTIQNGNLVYLRATDFRDEPQMTVTTAEDGIRPHAILQMKPAEARPTRTEPSAADTTAADSTATTPSQDPGVLTAPVLAEAVELVNPDPDPPGSPYIVDGDQIFIQGDDYFRATGNVEIERDSLNAFADSVEYDQVAARILLEGSARVEGPTYDLVGRTITLGMDGGDIDQLRAVDQAVLTGNDLELQSPEIRIYLLDDLLQRLVAVMAPASSGGAAAVSDGLQPIALANDFDLTADSIEVIVPGEVLEHIFAAGAARSVSHARDSLNVELLPEIARTDWLEGDTVIVTFAAVDATATQTSTVDSSGVDSSAVGDEAKSQYQIEKIVARGEARSLYRLPPSDTTAVPGTDAPAVHYLLGDQITILMDGDEVDGMEVIGQTQGVHLEPVPVVADSLSDSLAVKPAGTDTATAVDTTAVTTAGGPRPAAPLQEPSRVPDSGTPDGRPHIRESSATLNPWSGS